MLQRITRTTMSSFLALSLVALTAVACGAEEKTTPMADAPKIFVDTSTLKPAGDFKLLDLNGKPKTLADYKGKVVIVDFWATWCGPCKMSIPHLIELQNEYKEQGLEVVGISLDTTGPKAVGNFALAQKINYTILMGNDQVAAAYGGIKGIPVAFIVSQDGKIFRRYIGYRDKKVYDSDVRALLGLGPAGTVKS
ncbi:MAG: TlpA disulfide reductase family protein [Candidatus Eisenbacteria bacterium]|nr:TlpA disulfide reductase family protein [Candidatus Eisenbacteria bacterium]